MKKAALFIIALSSSLFISCKDEPKVEGDFNEQKEIVNEEQGLDGHTSINSLDWQGTYEGMLPCDGCDGTLTELTISTDNKFVLNSTKVSGDKKDKTSAEGLYQWDESGSNISMEIDGVTTMFKVGENKLILLDKDGNMLPEDKTEQNFLVKKEIADK